MRLRLRSADFRGLADEELMELAAGGEVRAFEVIFDRHAGPAYSLALRMCGRTAMAEDIVQEAFLSLWRSGTGYERTRGSVRAWVLSAVHNRAVDALRRAGARSGRDVSDEGVADRLPAPDRTDVQVERRDQAQRVRGVLGELPAEQRQVIELAYFGGLSHTQIAELLDLPPGTVKGRMRLGLSKMRSALGEAERVAL